MSVAQWAPWVSVFLGGCLSGAALLSLTAERAGDSPNTVSVPAPPEVPNEADEAPEPVEHDEGDTATEDDVTQSPQIDAEAALAESDEGVQSDEGPSAADILTELERAYQRQIAASEAGPSELAARAEEEASDGEGDLAPEAAPAPAPVSTPEAPVLAEAVDQRAPREDSELVADADVASERTEVVAAAHTRDVSGPVQQIAVVYQPVYVLPPATHPNAQTPAGSRRRSVGRDPWAPVTISPRHNPWSTSAASGGAWATVGVAGGAAGGVWAAGFTPRP